MNGSWRRERLLTSASVAFLAVTLAGCLKKPQAPATDQTMTSDIQAKLFADPVLKTCDIRVSTQDGVVTLAGAVNTDLEKAAVERFANQENGVKQVVDQLIVASSAHTTLAPEQSARQARKRTRDSARTSKTQKHASEVASAPSLSGTPAAPVRSPAYRPSPAPAPVIDQPTPPSATPAPPATVTIPAGTVMTVRMIDGVDSATSEPGQEFAATIAAPVAVGGQVLVPQNSSASVRLVTANNSGRFEGSAQLALELHSVTINGSPYHVQSSQFLQTGASRGRRTAEAVGGGSVIGGLIGAIAGGGKGAAIGAGIGAASGTGVQAASKRGRVRVPSETKIDFTLKAPVTTVTPGQ